MERVSYLLLKPTPRVSSPVTQHPSAILPQGHCQPRQWWASPRQGTGRLLSQAKTLRLWERNRVKDRSQSLPIQNHLLLNPLEQVARRKTLW